MVDGSFYFLEAEDGIRDCKVTGVQTCALPIFARTNSQSPNQQARRNQSDTTKRNPNARVTGDTMSQRLPSNQYSNVPNSDSTRKNTDGSVSAQGQSQYGVTQQTGQVDSTSLNQAIAALK